MDLLYKNLTQQNSRWERNRRSSNEMTSRKITANATMQKPDRENIFYLSLSNLKEIDLQAKTEVSLRSSHLLVLHSD